MSTLTTVKSILMGLAAQGSVTVTIPNDSDLVREMGPVEITRQVGPVELRIQTAPEGSKAKGVQIETNEKSAPVITKNQPVVTKKQNVPAPVKTETAPQKSDSKTAPAVVANQETQAKTPLEDTAVRSATQSTPVETNQEQSTGYAGLWYDHTGRSAIKISECGKGLCGQIAWLKDSAHKSVCGTSIIGDVEKVGNAYDNGWIYDIDRGKKFDVELKLLTEKKLRVKGYAGTKLLSKTMIWNRAPGDLELCS